MGILSSRRFVANVEINVNFRYDLDTRYCGGIFFVMRRGFEEAIPQTIYHDHYYKEAAVNAAAKKSDTVKLRLGTKESLDFERPDETLEERWARMLAFCDAHSDFREHQPALVRGTVEGQGGTYPITNYYRSITNPQIRIPWIDVDISLDYVAAVLVPCHIDAEIEEKAFEAKLKATFTGWRTNAPRAPTGRDVKVGLRLREADALALYRNGKKEGWIRIYHGPSAGQQTRSSTSGGEGGLSRAGRPRRGAGDALDRRASGAPGRLGRLDHVRGLARRAGGLLGALRPARRRARYDARMTLPAVRTAGNVTWRSLLTGSGSRCRASCSCTYSGSTCRR